MIISFSVPVTFKSPDGVSSSLQDIAANFDTGELATIDGEVPETDKEEKEQRERFRALVSEAMGKFIEYGEYLEVIFGFEFDTATRKMNCTAANVKVRGT